MSYTAPPQLPQDGEYAPLSDYNELRQLFGIGPRLTLGFIR
jgi:hypothetical protein